MTGIAASSSTVDSVDSRCELACERRIEKAVSRLVLREPWYASLLLRLNRKLSSAVPTAATDGQVLLMNPRFVETLSDEELLGVLIHETLHCALLHVFRRGTRQPIAWNWACDRVVNAAVRAGGYVLPPNCVPAANLASTAEEEYRSIPEGLVVQMLGVIGQDIQDSGAFGSSSRQKGSGIERQWKEALVSAQGMIPEHMRRAVDEILRTKVPWQDELALFVSVHHPSVNHTWSRPHRRISMYPGRRRIPQYTIAVCIDTSGSIDKETLTQFLTELRGISGVEGALVYALSSDAQIHRIYRPGEKWGDWIGGGGTDFRPAITWAEQQSVDALIYLTDGEGRCPSKTPVVPVLWVLTNQRTMPFGRHIILCR